METSVPPQNPPLATEPSLSLGSRFLAVFASPARAWSGLERRGQWWFPLLLTILVTMAGTALIYERAVVPGTMARLEAQVESGQVPAATLDTFEQQMKQWWVIALNVAATVIIVPVITLATALLPWLAAGFMLGHPFRYRDAFVVTAWAGLVQLPAQLLTFALAWMNETMTNLHIGFGALLPTEDPPSKLMLGLGTFLDHGIGPLAIWYVAVLALGTAALARAPRGRVAMAVGGLWLVVILFVAALTALFGPGA